MRTIKYSALIVFGSLIISLQAEPKVERSPTQIGTNIDLGQIVEGVNGYRDPPVNLHGQMINRISVSLNQSATINERLTIKVGVGGLFFYALPEDRNQASSRTTQFGPGVVQAQGIYSLGNPEVPWTFQFGFFPYKYNDDAKNLGEYLMRSGTYPGYLVTGGWNIVNNARYLASGLRVNKVFGNGLSADLNLFMERDVEPIYDLSPSLVLKYRPAPLFEMGLGTVFSHLLAAHPIKDTPKRDETKFKGDSLAPDDTMGVSYFTFGGVKLDAIMAINFGALFSEGIIRQHELKLYGEAALLGVKNYPYYYSDKLARLPMMVGFNFPTFGFLDMLAAEVEYRKWEFPNDLSQAYEAALPIWRIPGDDAATYDKSTAKKYNYKWSVYAKRKITEGVSIYAQAASDHMRSIRPDFTPERTPITRTPSQWYYLFRLEFGI
jgi:hypothetical protein